MRAFRWDNDSKRLVRREIPLPEPGPGEARIRVRAARGCLSDVHWIDGSVVLPYAIPGEITMPRSLLRCADRTNGSG